VREGSVFFGFSSRFPMFLVDDTIITLSVVNKEVYSVLQDCSRRH